MRLLGRIVRLPINDYLRALQVSLVTVNAGAVAVIAVSVAASWWIYVPIHELAHAFGCILAGGTVTRLEVDAVYGAALLRQVFPFVSVGSHYAGQLTGFDTHGSDLTYLATDAAPFVFTVLLGIPLLRAAASERRLWLARVEMGAGLPLAFAPFISATGDYYEMGSILVSRCVVLWCPSLPLERWRSDDLFKRAGELFFSGRPFTLGDIGGVFASFVVGILLAFLTYWIGTLWAQLILPRRGAVVRAAPASPSR